MYSEAIRFPPQLRKYRLRRNVFLSSVLDLLWKFSADLQNKIQNTEKTEKAKTIIMLWRHIKVLPRPHWNGSRLPRPWGPRSTSSVILTPNEFRGFVRLCQRSPDIQTFAQRAFHTSLRAFADNVRLELFREIDTIIVKYISGLWRPKEWSRGSREKTLYAEDHGWIYAGTAVNYHVAYRRIRQYRSKINGSLQVISSDKR